MGAAANSAGAGLTGGASGFSLASTALSGFGRLDQGITGALGQEQSGSQTAQMDEFQAQRLADAAEYGKAQADQTDMTMRQQTELALGNIMAIRASASTAAESPTGAAIAMRTQGQGDQERGIQVGNLEAQAAEDQKESAMYTTAAQDTLNAASTNALTSILGGVLGGGGSLLSGLSGLKFT